MSNVCVYSYADADLTTKYIDDNDYNYTGTWSSSGTYVASTLDVVTYATALYICTDNNVGDNPRRTPTRTNPTNWSIMSLLYEYQCDGSTSTGSNALAQAAYDLAVTGTNIAWAAYYLAQIGTNTGSAAYELAGSAYTIGTDAYALAGSAAADAAVALSTANGAFTIAVAGTNRAEEAYTLAMIGTNTGTAALTLAEAGSNLAWAAYVLASGTDGGGGGTDLTARSVAYSAYDIAVIGTNVGSTALSTADAAYAMAQIGTVLPFLTQLQDVNVPVPQAQQVLLFNGSVWIAGNAGAVASPGAFNFFLEGTNSGTNGYETLATEPSGGAEFSTTVTVNNGEFVPAQSFISFTADRDHLNAGIWRFATFASVSVQNRTAYSIVEMWVRGIDGSESMLFSGTSEPINSSTPTLYLTVLSRGSYGVSPTDKLVAKYYFTRTANPAVDVTLYYAGTDNTSLISTPIILEHNDLDGIQGGVIGERYHINADHSDAVTGANTPSATNPFATLVDVYSGTAFSNDRSAAAYTLAQIGTNTGSTAYSVAQSAYAMAQIGTAIPNFSAGGTMSGNLTVPNIIVGTGTVPMSQAIAGTIYYDMSGPAYQLTTVDATMRVSAKNTRNGAEICAVLISDGTQRAVTYDSGFSWFGTQVPYTSTTSSNKIIVALSCISATGTNILGATSAQI